MSNFNLKFDLRNHAIEQFLSRKRSPRSSLETRLYLNRQISKNVYKLKEKTRSGEDKWHVPTAQCVLISKYENGINVVVTIINDDRLIQEFNNADNDFMEKLSLFDTYNHMFDVLIDMVQTNKTEILERLSSRTKLHKAVVDNVVVKFSYNTNSKNIEIISQETLM